MRHRELAAAIFVLGWSVSAASGQTASMAVTAEVRAACLVTVEPADWNDAAPRVAVACGHKALRTLRVSTDGGEPVQRAHSVTRSAAAWREVRFVVRQPVALLAGPPPSALPPPPARVVTVTLDF